MNLEADASQVTASWRLYSFHLICVNDLVCIPKFVSLSEAQASVGNSVEVGFVFDEK